MPVKFMLYRVLCPSVSITCSFSEMSDVGFHVGSGASPSPFSVTGLIQLLANFLSLFFKPVLSRDRHQFPAFRVNQEAIALRSSIGCPLNQKSLRQLV